MLAGTFRQLNGEDGFSLQAPSQPDFTTYLQDLDAVRLAKLGANDLAGAAAVELQELSLFDGNITFYWTMTGRNTGPGGTGRAIKLSGSDEWTLAPDGLIATSKSSYDEAELQRQLTAPIPRGR